MTARRTYLDWNATAPLLPAAREAVLAALDAGGNASSVHGQGRAARAIVDRARRDVAALVGGDAANVVFTSGATEAASTLLQPGWRMGRAAVRVSRAYVCAADHPCTLSGGHFAAGDLTVIGVDGDGLLRSDELEKALATHDAEAGLALVVIHAANNETGVVQPVEAIGRMAKAAGAIVAFDAVQVAGRAALDIAKGYADFLILSSHKLGGPQGVGAMVGAGGVLMPAPLLRGGGQERGHRAGTENVAAIAGFGAAARAAKAALGDMDDVARMRDRFEAAICDVVPDAEIFGRRVARLPNTTFFAIPGVKAETAQIAFDLAGIAVSAGSACSSGKVGPSHVLKAMGKGDSVGALRVSIGRETGEDDLARFAEALADIAGRRAVPSQAA